MKKTLLILSLLLSVSVFAQAPETKEQSNKVTKTTNEPLYILDDIEITKQSLDTLQPKNIKSVTVYKDAKAIELYGEKGRNGVLVIESMTKKKINPTPSKN